MAGGTTNTSNESVVQIYQKVNGQEKITEFNLEEIRSGQVADIALEDGDIVVVDVNEFKEGLYGFFRNIGSIFSIGYGI